MDGTTGKEDVLKVNCSIRIRESAVHDHSCQGLWMFKVQKGNCIFQWVTTHGHWVSMLQSAGNWIRRCVCSILLLLPFPFLYPSICVLRGEPWRPESFIANPLKVSKRETDSGLSDAPSTTCPHLVCREPWCFSCQMRSPKWFSSVTPWRVCQERLGSNINLPPTNHFYLKYVYI